jgi:hypothetical protein
MNNEPVAWMFKTKQEYGGDVVFPDELEHTKFYYAEQKWNYELIPLYTHPAKTEDEPNWKEMYWEMHELNHKHWSELKSHPAKTLTDKEILELWDWNSGEILATDLLDFADAILRKAQEK